MKRINKTNLRLVGVLPLTALAILASLSTMDPAIRAGQSRTSVFSDKRESTAAFAPAAELAPNSQSVHAQDSSSCFPAESTVQRTINGNTYTLHAFSGKYVQWEVPDSWLVPGAFSASDMRQLVDLTDLLYAHYVELVQGEPAGSGLLSISVNPDDSGTAGVGTIGAKGIILTAGWATAPDFKRDLYLGIPNGIIVHEMGHNFDIYNEYLEYYPDMVHAWTTVVQYYLPYYMRVGDYLGDADDALERWFRKITVPWDAMGASASWATCVRNGGGCEANGVRANDAWGGIVLRFERLHGESALRRVFSFLKGYTAVHPPPTTPEDKNDLLVLALAAGAQMNITCELDTWHWEISQTVRTQLAQEYPGTDAFCKDADGDGYSPAAGDLNDSNPAVHPGAMERKDGIDDDCDGVVDDLLIHEQSDFPPWSYNIPTIGSIPLRITGHASGADQDAVRVSVGSSLHLKVMIRTLAGFKGELDVGSVGDGGASWNPETLNPNSMDSFGADIPPNKDGFVAIKPASGSSGDYDMILYGTPLPAANPITLTTTRASDAEPLQINADINTAAIEGVTPTDIRFWATGVGFFQTLPIARNVSFQWAPPAGYCGDGIRGQLVAGDHPISAATSLLAPALLNISTRLNVGTADNVLIAGFIVTGNAPKQVIVRAIGPSLAEDGLSDVLADPVLELHKPSGAVVTNDNWKDGQQAAIDALKLAPSDDRESAILASLDPGAYTAIVRGKDGGTGTGLVEVYDVDPAADSTLANISTRGFVDTGDNVMIGGVIVRDTNTKVLVRAIGPELTTAGVMGALADPTLELHNADGSILASNDDWKDTQQTAITATKLAPKDSKESAILATLPAGSYTAIVKGKNNTTGVALVEAYNVSP